MPFPIDEKKYTHETETELGVNSRHQNIFLKTSSIDQ